jgi:hypothetical protein
MDSILLLSSWFLTYNLASNHEVDVIISEPITAVRTFIKLSSALRNCVSSIKSANDFKDGKM